MWWIIYINPRFRITRDGPYETKDLADYYMENNLTPFMSRCVVVSEEHIDTAIMQKSMELSA